MLDHHPLVPLVLSVYATATGSMLWDQLCFRGSASSSPTYCCIAGPLCSLIELPQAEPFTLTTACCRGITLPCGTPAGPSHPHSVRQRSCDKGPDCQTSKARRLRAMQMSEPRTTTSGRCNPSVAHFPKFQTFATHPSDAGSFVAVCEFGSHAAFQLEDSLGSIPMGSFACITHRDMRSCTASLLCVPSCPRTGGKGVSSSW